jgi:hypothetical protein
MSNKALYRVALIAAILSALSWFAYVFGQLSLPALSEIDNPQLFFQTIQDTRTIFLLYGWGGVLGTLLCVPYLLAFYTAIKESASVVPLVLLSLIIALIGTVLAVIGFFKPLTLIYSYVPMGLEAGPEALPLLKTAASVAVEVLELPWNVGSFLLFGLGIGLIAYYALRTATGPKWLNGVGIIAGLSGIVWLRVYLPFLLPVSVFLIVLNILTIMIWSIGLSVVIVRRA